MFLTVCLSVLLCFFLLYDTPKNGLPTWKVILETFRLATFMPYLGS